jgi:sensor histidine kinase YesM
MKKLTRKYKFLLHLVAWLAYMACECGSLLIDTPPKSIAVYVLLPFVINISVFYFCVEYLFPVFYDRKKIFRFILLNLLVISLYLILRGWMAFAVLQHYSKPQIITLKDFPITYFYTLIWHANWFMALAAAYWIAKRLIATKKRSNALLENYYVQELHEEEIKQVIVTAELAYIRAQINPHFLFNTLNFFYSSIYPLSKDIAKSVLMLSDMMRFVIENNEGGGTTDLSLEIKHIENYIKLNQLRFNHGLNIDFKSTGLPGDKKIIPFILMTLVENAFKHGDLTNVKDPLKIQLDMLDESIRFCITNKIRATKLYEHNGIGMNNLERCLELFYDNKFNLTIQDDGQYYSCLLEIELNMVSADAFQLG